MEDELLGDLDAPDEVHIRSSRILTEVEKNAVYYAGGFLAKKLLKKHLSKPNFHSCLKELIADDASEISSLEGASTWLQHTNRGGLCKLSQLGYKLFCTIEEKTYGILDEKFKNKCSSTTDQICDVVADDQEIQDLWSVVAFDIIVVDEEGPESTKLLTDVVREWIIMRGHSLRGNYMEEYMKKKKEKDKMKSLRKTLKTKSK